MLRAIPFRLEPSFQFDQGPTGDLPAARYTSVTLAFVFEEQRQQIVLGFGLGTKRWKAQVLAAEPTPNR